MANQSNSFFRLQVSGITQETPDCKSIRFVKEDNLKAFFQAQAGQYVTVLIQIKGTHVRRCYSICEQDGESFSIAVKKVEGGLCSSYLIDQLQVGDYLEVMPPKGSFLVREEPQIKSLPYFYVGVAAGSGITPVIAIVRELLRVFQNAHFFLIYQNRDFANTIFREELMDLKNKYLGRFQIVFLWSKDFSEIPLFSGRLDLEKLESIYEHFYEFRNAMNYFLCGPEAMTDMVCDFLKNHGVSENSLIRERFINQGQSIAKLEEAKTKAKSEHKTGQCKIQVKINGSYKNLEIPFGETVLNSLLKSGVDAPFACQGGVCSTCKVQLEKGELTMPVNYSLEKDQLQKGFYLSCCSFPMSEAVTINYDI